jgi:hypothetical protein
MPAQGLAYRLGATVLAVALLALAAPGSALAWANNGDAYGTHDWFVDQAARVLDGRAADWFDPAVARLSSDDPDTYRSGDTVGDHVYRETGNRGGAVQRASDHYSAALDHHRAGVASRLAGDSAAARDAFDRASHEIGLLSHYLTDILQPYHAAYAGLNKEKAHAAYERLVAPLMRRASDQPAWHSASRSVAAIANIRSTVAAAAAYSRSKFSALHAEVKASPDRLTPRMRDITGKLARRAAQDLADIIWSISRGVGESPDVAKLTARIRWVGAASTEPSQAVFVTARDDRGRPIEGLEVTISWPLADGRIQTVTRWTDPTGFARYSAPVGGGPLMTRRHVTVAAAGTPGSPRTTDAWFMVTRPLADGSAGFRTVVADATVAPGETAVVTTVARDRKGRPMAGLLVTWTWKIGTKTIRTRGLTDADGRARSTLLVTTDTPTTRITVSAHVQAASRNRYSSTTLRRS